MFIVVVFFFLMWWVVAPMHRRAFAFVKYTDYEASHKAIKEEVISFYMFHCHQLILNN